jgi:hypothetical protein
MTRVLPVAVLLWLSCSPEPTPVVALPSNWSRSASSAETTVDFWVFGFDAEAPPAVRVFETGLRQVAWRPSSPQTTPVGARELRVVVSRSEGTIVVADVNEVSLRSSGIRLGRAPRLRAVPYLAGSRTVLVIQPPTERVSLVTPDRAALPGERFECLPAADETTLESEVVWCSVRAPPPLTGETAAVRSVRARLEGFGEVAFTNEVELP